MITRSKNSDQTAVMAVPEAVDATSLCECVLDDLSGSEVNNGQIFGVDEKLSSPPLISPPLKRKRSTKSWIKPSSTSTLKSTIEIGLPENYVSTKKVFKQAVLSNCIKKDQLEKDSDENCILGTTPCWESFVVKPNIPENASLTVENLALKKAAENNSLDEREKNNAVELSVEENNEEMDRHFKRRMSRPIEQNAQEISCEIKSPKMSVENILLEMTVDDDSVWNDSLEIEEQKIEHQGTAPDEVTKLAVDSDTGSEHNLNDVSTSKSSEKFNGSIDHAVEVKCEGSTDSELNNRITSDKFQSLQDKSENIHSIHEGDVKKEGLENCIQSDEIYSSEKKSSENSNFICEENVIKEEICNRELRVELRRLKVEEIAKYCQDFAAISLKSVSLKVERKTKNTVVKSPVKKNLAKPKVLTRKQWLERKKIRKNPFLLKKKNQRKLHRCKHCKKKFLNEKMLQRHLESACISLVRFRCSICFRKYNSEERLNEHIQSRCDTLKIFCCNVCNRGYNLKRLLIIHTTPICRTLRPQYKCNICQKRFFSRQKKKNHLREHGILPRSHLCEICGKIVNNKFSIHLRTHSNDSPFTCDSCSKSFKTLKSLKDHKKIHSENRLLFTCAECGKSFSKRDFLKKHMAVHGMITSLNYYKCNECGKSIKSKRDFETHLRTHLKPKPMHMCKECGNGFSNIREFKRHTRTHKVFTGVSSEDHVHVCEICKLFYKNKRSLTRHEKNVHGKKTPLVTSSFIQNIYVCSECGKSFTTKFTLDTHKRAHFTKLLSEIKDEPLDVPEVKPGICDECGYCFLQDGAIKPHKCIDSQFPDKLNDKDSNKLDLPEKKPYLCVSCGRCFSENSKLKLHIKMKHNDLMFPNCQRGEEPLDLAAAKPSMLHEQEKFFNHQHNVIEQPLSVHKAFNSQYNVNKHSLAIQKELIVCDICNKTLSSRRNLRRHLLTVHKPSSVSNDVQTQTPTLQRLLSGELKPQASKNYGQTFHSKQHLKPHSVSQSNFQKSFSCPVCRREFRKQINLKNHMFVVHKIEGNLKLYGCPTCGKKFVYDYKLQEHLRTHTGEKPFGCNLCEFKCSRLHGLKKHCRRSHGVEYQGKKNSFSCEFCNMSFPNMPSLNQHQMYVHQKITFPKEYLFKISDGITDLIILPKNECGPHFEEKLVKLEDKEVTDSMYNVQQDPLEVKPVKYEEKPLKFEDQKVINSLYTVQQGQFEEKPLNLEDQNLTDSMYNVQQNQYEEKPLKFEGQKVIDSLYTVEQGQFEEKLLNSEDQNLTDSMYNVQQEQVEEKPVKFESQQNSVYNIHQDQSSLNNSFSLTSSNCCNTSEKLHSDIEQMMSMPEIALPQSDTFLFSTVLKMEDW